MNVTALQAAMLKRVALNELTPKNGGEPDSKADCETYADMVIEDAQDRGVFTSLINAGLAWHNGIKTRDGAVGLTQAGFEAYKALPK